MRHEILNKFTRLKLMILVTDLSEHVTDQRISVSKRLDNDDEIRTFWEQGSDGDLYNKQRSF